ncbi:MAG TPA: HAMP domain-containing sensor histidine kinase [Bacteroidales bacterium]|nr:HAMP domain-containing sensor histidine kinase [Bacteroidales bacterium]HPS63480.1 HAMP domain-containing sensor histidine kinase [Bacteroidales bacterium]
MKSFRTRILILLSTLALLAILAIQVVWILQAAKMKEELFNEKAEMVLSRTADALSSDRETCKSLQIRAGRNEMKKVDSLFNHFMRIYHIHIRYYFEVKPGTGGEGLAGSHEKSGAAFQPGSYSACVGGEEPGEGFLLKLVFPGKKQFILAEMGPMFIASVILVLVVLALSWINIFSLLKEKRISEQTSGFLNNMTHEFRTPLTNISLAAKMILKHDIAGQPEKIRHFTGIILDENEKLHLQVEQVLSMTALERGEIPLTRTRLDLHERVRDMARHMSLQLESRQAEMTLDLRAENPMVEGDPIHLSNVLNNLVDNALKYSRENPAIHIRTFNTAPGLVLEVTDRGIGVEKRYQEKVFEKFFRVPTGDVHDVKGFGLGLPYVKTIVEMHGGSVGVQSEPGKGTTITVCLPNG